MKDKASSPYLTALKNELSKTLSILRQRKNLKEELDAFSEAIKTFVEEDLHLTGECKTFCLPSACVGVGLKTIGDVYEVRFMRPGISPIRLVIVTLAKNGLYPCSIRSDNVVQLCKSLTEVRNALANYCKTSCLRIVEYAGKAKSINSNMSENIASMGGVGENPHIGGSKSGAGGPIRRR